MSEQRCRICVCMLYDFKFGKNAAKSHQNLCKSFGNDVILESQVRRWFQKFRGGNETLDDEDHSRRPSAVDEESLKREIELDPRQTTRELAQMFGVSQTCISEHLHKIGKKNRQGKWVPHTLSDSNRATRITMAGILPRFSRNRSFYDSILTSDKENGSNMIIQIERDSS